MFYLILFSILALAAGAWIKEEINLWAVNQLEKDKN